MTRIADPYGQLWAVIAVLLLIFRRTRRAGISVFIAYAAVYLIGRTLLKHLISRPRPCQIDQAFALLVARPSSPSFPSTHSAWAFAAATAVFMQNRKTGIAASIVAAPIAFSRLCLFPHFPTDALFGIPLGIALGVLANRIVANLARRFTSHGDA